MGMAQKSGYVSVTTRSGDPDKDLILERSHGAFDSAVAEEFLIRYAASGQKTRSAQEVGYTGQHINNVAKNDECFARAVKEAYQLWTERLEQEAFRRGVEGVDQPVFNTKQGTIIGHIRKYSDRMLELMLRKADPVGYANKPEIQMNVNAGVLLMPVPTSAEQPALPIEDEE